MICIVTQLKNEAKRIREFVEFHINKIGIDKIIIYADDPLDNSIEVIQSLINEGYNVKLCNTDGVGYTSRFYTSPNDYGGQISFIDRIRRSYLTEMNYMNSNETVDGNDWAIFVDVDEFLIPTADLTIHEYVEKIVPSDINRIFLPSYDMICPIDLDKSVIDQAVYRWSDATRDYAKDGYFKNRHKSMTRICKTNRVDCVHQILSGEKYITTGGSMLDIDPNEYISADKSYFKLFHYRNDGLIQIYDEYDNTAVLIKDSK